MFSSTPGHHAVRSWHIDLVQSPSNVPLYTQAGRPESGSETQLFAAPGTDWKGSVSGAAELSEESNSGGNDDPNTQHDGKY